MGGVIGGVAFIAIVVFCIWKFWLKGRRHEVEIEEEWDDDEDDGMEKSNASVFTREARSRASTHTVASMASTVLTRASNIIQIAYIPGVTNRSNGGSDVLVPPVPPIPSAVGTPSSTNSRFSDQLLFMPGDLRDSTYSDMSAMTDARRPGSICPSLARTSMASTIFRDSAVVHPMPATQIIGGKAAIVSVGTGSTKSSTPVSTPPVPSVDFAKHGGNKVKPVMIKMPSQQSSSDGSSAMSSLKTMKPVALNIIRKDKKVNAANGVGVAADSASIRSATSAAPSSRDEKRATKASLAPSELSVDTHRRARQSGLTHRSTTYSDFDDEEDGVDEHERGRQSLLDTKVPQGVPVTSPFTDAAATAAPETGSLKVATPTTPRANVERGKSPFDDPESEDEKVKDVAAK